MTQLFNMDRRSHWNIPNVLSIPRECRIVQLLLMAVPCNSSYSHMENEMSFSELFLASHSLACVQTQRSWIRAVSVEAPTDKP